MCVFSGINVDRACFSDALISDQDPCFPSPRGYSYVKAPGVPTGTAHTLTHT